ncbi:MAG: Rap1a/Tai family immunity protein [Alphaproteobacteria bacterium]|nr:Rap1a/Tai family immunity protein [Alphaproteobacteria bacterium]
MDRLHLGRWNHARSLKASFIAFVVVCLFGVAATMQQSHAGPPFADGHLILDMCSSQGSYFGKGYCMGYLAGASDQIRTSADAPQGNICASQTANDIAKFIDLTVRYLRDHPNELNRSASSLLTRILHNAEACQGHQ